MAVADLALHVLFDLMQGHVARAFDKGLNILLPSAQYQFAHGVELGKLGLVVSVSCTAGAQSVA